MIQEAVDFVTRGGPVKTPVTALLGFITWSTVKGWLEAIVLIATAVIVIIHLLNALTRQWCPRRRTGNKSACHRCPLQGKVLCPIKTRDYDDI